MKIISFSRTTAALVAGEKSVTRREWTDAHAAKFKPGELAQAWSASPHRKGRKVGTIRILSVTYELTREIPDADWKAEGFEYMERHGLDLGKELSCAALWRVWRQSPDMRTYVIRLELVSLEPGITEADFLPNREAF